MVWPSSVLLSRGKASSDKPLPSNMSKALLICPLVVLKHSHVSEPPCAESQTSSTLNCIILGVHELLFQSNCFHLPSRVYTEMVAMSPSLKSGTLTSEYLTHLTHRCPWAGLSHVHSIATWYNNSTSSSKKMIMTTFPYILLKRKVR